MFFEHITDFVSFMHIISSDLTPPWGVLVSLSTHGNVWLRQVEGFSRGDRAELGLEALPDVLAHAFTFTELRKWYDISTTWGAFKNRFLGLTPAL